VDWSLESRGELTPAAVTSDLGQKCGHALSNNYKKGLAQGRKRSAEERNVILTLMAFLRVSASCLRLSNSFILASPTTHG